MSLKMCNCKGIRDKKFELEMFANNWDIFMLMETFLKPEQSASHIKGYKTVHMDRINDKGGGIAFLIKKKG